MVLLLTGSDRYLLRTLHISRCCICLPHSPYHQSTNAISSDDRVRRRCCRVRQQRQFPLRIWSQVLGISLSYGSIAITILPLATCCASSESE